MQDKAIGIDKTKITPAWQRIGKRLVKILPFFLLTTGIFLISNVIANHVSVGPVKTLNSSSHKTSTPVAQPIINQFTFYLLVINAALAFMVAVVWENRKDSRLLALEEALIQPGITIAKEENLDNFIKVNSIYYLPLSEKQSATNFYFYSWGEYSEVYEADYYVPEILVKDFYKESCRLSYLKYSTECGERILSLDDTELNGFFINKDELGFAQSKWLPYRYHREESTLTVTNSVESEAFKSGWLRSVELPYIFWTVLGPSYSFILGEINDYPLGVLVVSIIHEFGILHEVEAELLLLLGFANAVPMPYIRAYNSFLGIPQLVVDYNREDAPATLAGYAQAVDLPWRSREVYIEHLNMLDTEYAAMLADPS